MKFGTVVVCSKCKQPIVSGQGFGYVCFKIPGKEANRLNLMRAIRKLPAGNKKLFFMHDVIGYQHSEIAGLVGCSTGCSKSQVHKARKEKTIMTLESTSSGGRVRDALSGRPKVAIVTGASSGIGLEMVKRLIEKGYRVVANSRRITSAMTLHSTADLKLVDGDIGIEETAKHVVGTAIQNFGTADLLVNNAGVFIPKPFTEYTAEDFLRAMQTNLAGFFYVSQLAVAQMRLQKFGHVVNISTSLVSQPIAGVPGSLSNLTKAGLESVTRALAIEFAAEGIRFNAIAPGVVNTPMHQAETHEFLKQLSPMKRLAEVEEVADLLLYLESAHFVNGEVVHLDGGAHAGKW